MASVNIVVTQMDQTHAHRFGSVHDTVKQLYHSWHVFMTQLYNYATATQSCHNWRLSLTQLHKHATATICL